MNFEEVLRKEEARLEKIEQITHILNEIRMILKDYPPELEGRKELVEAKDKLIDCIIQLRKPL
jgi:hypothetical protein